MLPTVGSIEWKINKNVKHTENTKIAGLADSFHVWPHLKQLKMHQQEIKDVLISTPPPTSATATATTTATTTTSSATTNDDDDNVVTKYKCKYTSLDNWKVY